MPPRNRPPNQLPPAVRDHPAVTAACQQRDLGRLFRTINNLTEEPERFTATHIGILCQMPTTRIQDYMRGKHATPSLETVARVADGLRIPGNRFGLTPRPWEHDPDTKPPLPPADTPIGQNIRNLRLAQRKTQEVIAQLAGIEPHHYGRIERGTRNATITVLHNIARALGTTPAQLLDQPQPAHQGTAPPNTPTPDNGEPNPPRPPSTLLHQLVIERHWRTYETFRHRFEKAARELAATDQAEPRIADLTVSRSQYERWLRGHLTTQPHAHAAHVLEHLFGTTTELLLAPPPPQQPHTPHTPEPQQPAADTAARGIGELIQTRRHERGLSQDDLADALNEALPDSTVTRTEISRYESETRMPQADRIIEALSQVLDTPEPVLRAAIRRSWAQRRHHLYGTQPRAWQRQDPSHQPNDRIREHRHARGWTQQDAADAVTRAITDATGTIPTGIDAAWIGRLERGRIKWPSAEHRAALRTAYGATTDQDLGLNGLRTGPDSPTTPHDTADLPANSLWPLPAPGAAVHLGLSTEEADDVYRREFLRTTFTAGALSITAPTMTALMAAAYESAMFSQRAGATNIHPGTLEQIEADIERIGRAYLTQPLGELIIEMRFVRNMVFTALEGRQHPSQARQLYLNAAQLCGLMASAASDLGHYDVARTHGRTAAICAELAGHPSVMAWIAATQSLIEFWDNRPAEALRRVQAGHEYVTSDIDALRLYSLTARANARLGDAKSARQTIDQMTIIMDRTDASAHQSIFDFPAANALRCAGSSYLWLNEFADAQNSLSRALEIFETQPEGGSYAHVAVTRIDLTLAHLGNNDFDAAKETLRPVLELSPHRRLSGMTRRFDDLRAALAQAPYGKLPAARDLAEHLDTLTSEVSG